MNEVLIQGEWNKDKLIKLYDFLESIDMEISVGVKTENGYDDILQVIEGEEAD